MIITESKMHQWNNMEPANTTVNFEKHDDNEPVSDLLLVILAKNQLLECTLNQLNLISGKTDLFAESK